MIALNNISFTYDQGSRPALSGLTFELARGQLCMVLGRSGAGKSTLCALLGGFIPRFFDGALQGSVTVDGLNVAELGPAGVAGRVALVTSDAFSQISGTRFTVFEEVAFGLENLGVPQAQIIERVEWVLDALDLDELRDRSPYALSGGQQQRLALASALALRPAALLLDEPSAQLDPAALERLGMLLRRLANDGTTLVVAEQRLEWVAGLAERVLVLDNGALLLDGPPDQVLRDPTLRERGVGWPRAAELAAAARDAGAWPERQLLPVTLEGWTNAEPPAPSTDPTVPDAALAPPPPQHSALSTQHSALVRVEDAHFSYPSGVQALSGASLALAAGERVAIVGRNGAGKSTLVRHLNGLLRPSSGRVLYGAGDASQDIRKRTVASCARQVGIVFQDVRNQLFARSVREELRFGPRNLGYPAERIERLVDEALAALDLAGVADEHPYDLPPARRRLVAVAAVLAMDTPVLVMDEPTAGLDGAGVAGLVRLVHDLAARGRCVVTISHDLDFCADTAERVVLVQEGRVALDSSWQALDERAVALLDEQVGLPTVAELSRRLGMQLAWTTAEFVAALQGRTAP
jgi:energy-coupling factor transport system ATP-binding protein